MRTEIIDNSLTKFLSIHTFEVHHQIGKHSQLKISGNISEIESEKIKYTKPDNGISFSIIDLNCSAQKIFSGIITKLDLHIENSVYFLILECVSSSLLMDKKKKFKTFQSSNETYRGVTDIISEGTNYSIIVPNRSSEKIKKMLVQYDETDWEFLNRVASRLKTFVITDTLHSTPYVSIGFPKRKDNKEIQYSAFKMIQTAPIGIEHRKEFVDTTKPYFILKSRDVHFLCDRILFINQEYIVTEIKTVYIGEELLHYYTIKNVSSIKTNEYFNMSLIGASFEGKIIAIESDLVKVRINNDVEQLEHKWFYYATPFSQPDGPGWYFMPEKEDGIRLSFPCESEHESYVSSSVHITHGDRSNPEIKYIRTIRNQEIRFEPDKMIITDGHGSAITLDHEKGIIIETDSNITSSSKFDTRISAKGKISLASEDSTVIRNNSSIVKLEENIDIASTHTRIQ